MLRCGLGKVKEDSQLNKSIPFLVFDSYGGVPIEAMLEGGRISLGDFNSCNDVEQENGDIRGNYCSVLAVDALGGIIEGAYRNPDALADLRNKPLFPSTKFKV